MRPSTTTRGTHFRRDRRDARSGAAAASAIRERYPGPPPLLPRFHRFRIDVVDSDRPPDQMPAEATGAPLGRTPLPPGAHPPPALPPRPPNPLSRPPQRTGEPPSRTPVPPAAHPPPAVPPRPPNPPSPDGRMRGIAVPTRASRLGNRPDDDARAPRLTAAWAAPGRPAQRPAPPARLPSPPTEPPGPPSRPARKTQRPGTWRRSRPTANWPTPTLASTAPTWRGH